MKKLLLIFCLIFIHSCGRIVCPAFPDKLLTWVDYKQNDVLEYKSLSDTLSHIVVFNFKSEEWSYKHNNDSECGAHAGFKTEENKNGYLLIGECHVHSSGSRIILSYQFVSDTYNDSFWFEYDESKDQYQNLDKVGVTDYELNGVILSNIGFIEKTDNKTIKKIYFTSKEGLIAFVDKNNIEWQLVE